MFSIAHVHLFPSYVYLSPSYSIVYNGLQLSLGLFSISYFVIVLSQLSTFIPIATTNFINLKPLQSISFRMTCS